MTNQLHQLQVFDFKLSGAKARPIRTFGSIKEPWFAATDVCAVLGLSNPSAAVRSLDEDEKKTIRVSDGARLTNSKGQEIDSDDLTLTISEGASNDDSLRRIEDSQLEKDSIGGAEDQTYTTKGHRTDSGPQRGGAQFLVLVDESGLYALITRSRKPRARAFRKWVTREVMPAIRKTGRYEAAGAPMRDAKPMTAGDYQLARIIAKAVAAKGPIQDTPTNVFQILNKLCADDVAQSEVDWPDNPIRFGRALKRVDTALRDLEVAVTRHRGGRARLVRLETGGQQSGPLALPSIAQLEDSVARLAATLAQMKATR